MSNPSIPISARLRSRTQIYRAIAILLGSIAAGYAAYWVCTLIGTAEMRSAVASPDSGLIWLRKEFHLTDAQFERIKSLHADYAAKCDVMCQRIMDANAALETAISRNKQVTPEVQQAITEVSRVKQQCEQSTLAHIYEVSAQMDPSSAERYLQIMKQKIIQPGLPTNTSIGQ